MITRWPPIGDHRLLGDGTTVALVRPDASVDWWCAPEPDSAPLLWSLLDPGGAEARYVGAHVLDTPDAVAGPALTTVVRVGRERVECLDGLLVVDSHPALVRLVRGLDADLDLHHRLSLGAFDRPPTRWEGRTAHLGDLDVVVTGGTSPGGEDVRVVARRGEWAALVIAAGGRVPADADALHAQLVDARDEVEGRVAAADLPVAHQDRCADAIRVLEACTYRATGSVLAAPTTSLPEAVGGDRQFDYRFSWLRDSSLALAVAHHLGAAPSALPYVDHLRQLGPDGIVSAPVRTVRGEEVPPERTIAGIAGWQGSIPVRVGNAASEQVQYDALGFVLEGIAVHLRSGARLDRDLWAIVRHLADRALEGVGEATSGIWELRQPADLVAADIGRWVTLDRAVRIARRRRPWTSTPAWVRGRDAARRRVLASIHDDGTVPQVHGGETPDGSGLLIVVLGLVEPSDARAHRIIDATRRHLGAGAFLHRYPPTDADGFHGREAPMVPVSWWLVSALALCDRVEEAEEVADGLCAELPDLLPEQWDPARSEALGNSPLLWSHMEAARALRLLDRARARSG